MKPTLTQEQIATLRKRKTACELRAAFLEAMKVPEGDEARVSNRLIQITEDGAVMERLAVDLYILNNS